MWALLLVYVEPDSKIVLSLFLNEKLHNIIDTLLQILFNLLQLQSVKLYASFPQ